MDRRRGSAEIDRPAAPGARMGAGAAIVAVAGAVLLAALPARAQTRFEFTEVHMGTPVRLVLYGSEATDVRRAARATYARIAELDDVMSDYRPRSEVRVLSDRPREWVAVSEDLFTVLARAIEVAALTGGAFDPTVGPFVQLWRESRRTRRLPDASALAAARERVGWRLLQVDSSRRAVRLGADGMTIDLGGIAKGYILQQGLEVLRAHGHHVAMIEAGGDVVVGDAPPAARGWSIDVRGAGNALRARARALVNTAIATSGGSEQFVEIDGRRYSHVVDPRTGLGRTQSIDVTVIAADGATADALATAASVLGPVAAARLPRTFPGILLGFHERPD